MGEFEVPTLVASLYAGNLEIGDGRRSALAAALHAGLPRATLLKRREAGCVRRSAIPTADRNITVAAAMGWGFSPNQTLRVGSRTCGSTLIYGLRLSMNE